VSVVLLTFVSPQIATFALEFGSPEYFALAVFGLSIIASVSGDSLIKGPHLGSTWHVPGDGRAGSVMSSSRFTFGYEPLTSGIQFIAVMIGLFGIAEGLYRYQVGLDDTGTDQVITDLIPDRDTLNRILPLSTVSGVAGTIIGAISGAGGDIASFVTYNEAKRWLDDGTFGHGDIRGVAAAESGTTPRPAGH